MDRINILHIIDHYRIGGPGKTIINSAKFIDSRRFVVHISSFINPEKGCGEFPKVVIEQKIPYIGLPDRRGVSCTQLWRLRRYIRKNKIRILHTHGYKSNIVGIFLKWMIRELLIVSTYHGWIRNDRRQHFFVSLDQLFPLFFDGIITVCHKMLREFPTFAIRRTKHEVIQNAIVIENYVPKNHRDIIRERFDVHASDLLIGVFGRLSHEKGCLEMLEAFEKIKKSLPGAKLIFIGEGPLYQELQDRVEQCKLRSDVILAGYQYPIQPFYEALDLFVCPSHTEGISNVILEAMAYKIPIVATKVGGTPEIIKDGISGLLVQPNNPHAMERAICSIVHSPELRRKIAHGGFRNLQTRYGFRERMRKIEQFYESLMNGE